MSIFRPRSGSNRAHVGDGFRPYRSVVRSFPLLSPPCLPSWTSKNVANMCVIATGGLHGRLQWCIRHDFDDILMFPTPFWWYFDVSDIILVPFFTFRQLFFMIFLKIASRRRGKHIFKYRHKAFLIKNLTFWTSKPPKSSPCWWWFSALSLCCSLLAPFIPSMPPKLNLKKCRIRVYYCYRWLPWATSLIYPT